MKTDEKKYKNALEWARQVMNGETGFIRKEVEDIFPELKESEDERIRKELKRAIAVALDYSYFDKETADNILAWLEKQESVEEIYYIPKGFYAEIDDDKVVIKKGKKPTAWSKEDEKNLNGVINELEANKSEAPEYDYKPYDGYIDWLKSLRNRVQKERR